MNTHNKLTIIYFITAFLVGIILFALNILVGSVHIPLREALQVIFNKDNSSALHVIIFDYRFPQAVTALLSGAALAVAGLMMQTLFRNPLADPSILGISSGAGLGVASVILVSGSLAVIPHWTALTITSSAFFGAVVVLAVITLLSRRLNSMVMLIIIGIMIAYLTGAITDILKYFSRKEEIHAFVIWGLGDFSAVGTSNLDFYTVTIIAGLLCGMLLSKTLNMLIIGESYAENLGLNIRRATALTIAVSGFLTAVVTAFCGPIAFLGLAVPHLARFIFHSSNHIILTPASALIGSDLALACNLIARLPGLEETLPINAVTALIGAPIVIYVIFRYRK